MKRYRSFFKEDLNAALAEPSIEIAGEAKKNKLKHVGRGKYEDKDGKISHSVVNDRLVPIDRAMKTNSFKANAGNEKGSLTKDFSKQSAQTHSALISTYVPDAYSPEELDSVMQFTSGAGVEVNKMLAQLPIGASPGHLEMDPEGGDELTTLIINMDSALEKGKTPIDFHSYILLGQGIDEISPGKTFAFKGFKSTTINIEAALGETPNPQTTILQILVKAGSPGMYVDDYSAVMGENEFILPRGSVIAVNAGPKKLVVDQTQITFYDCELMS
jgi:ADP-ribosyltransferase exoenzyme